MSGPSRFGPSASASELEAGGPRSILLLCDNRPHHANTVLDHIEAFLKWSRHRVYLFNPQGVADRRLLDLDEFDVVVLHYSIFAISDMYLSPEFREKVRRFEGLKIQFLQDDYRLVDQTCALTRYMGINVLFTLYPESEIPRVFTEARLPGIIKRSSLAGYVPDSLIGRATEPIEKRPIDIGYRGRSLPWWLGELGQEKIQIGQGVLARAAQHGLRCDIAWREEERIYGREWIRFLTSCKTTLGTESGASITDFDGSVQLRVKEYLVEHPEATFAEVRDKVLAPFEWNVPIVVASPRIFEAVALRTGLILFAGHYSGVVKPWTHYLPLAKDFSNLSEIVERLRDRDFMHGMIERAYEHVVVSGRFSFRAFIAQFDDIVSTQGGPHGKRGKLSYRLTLAQSELLSLALLQRLGLAPWIRRARSTLMAVRLIASRPAISRILRVYLQDGRLRHSIPIMQMIIDLMRWSLLGHARAGSGPVRERLDIRHSFDPQSGVLKFVTRPGGAPTRSESDEIGDIRTSVAHKKVHLIVWNHSLAGATLQYRGRFSSRVIGVGEDGTHRFRGLELFAGYYPDVFWAALEPLLAHTTVSGPPRAEAHTAYCGKA